MDLALQVWLKCRQGGDRGSLSKIPKLFLTSFKYGPLSHHTAQELTSKIEDINQVRLGWTAISQTWCHIEAMEQ